MAALNYIVYIEFQVEFLGGAPMNPKYQSFEKNRMDV